jgi:hypothetical protein
MKAKTVDRILTWMLWLSAPLWVPVAIATLLRDERRGMRGSN